MSRKKWYSLTFVFVFVGFSFVGCQKNAETDTLFSLLSSKKTGVDFNNSIVENETVNPLDFAPIYNGGGVAIGDINNDGLEDIFFGGNTVSSRLYLNQGNLQFKDITESASVTTDVWCNGISIIDINADGLRDIYVSVSGPDISKRKNLLFINKGDLTFEEKAADYGLDHDSYSTHSAFLDYDNDGDLDMYLLVYGNNEGMDLKIVNKKITDGSSLSNDQLFRNNGDGTFSNVTLEAGIKMEGYGLGIAVNDINNDNWPDIYVSNDFLFDDIVYINNQDGTFSDKSKDYLKHTSQFGMGVDFQDFNNDEKPDIVQVDMMPEDNYRQKKILGPMHYDFFNLSIKEGYTPQYMRNTLQLNQGEKGFSEIGQFAGIHETDWSWAPLFADYDANGQKDLIITNGFRRNLTDFDFRDFVNEQLQKAEINGEDPDEVALEIIKNTNDVKLPNYAYVYNGDLTFSDVTESWGLGTPTWSNGQAYSDLDNDGDLDIVISNIDDKAHIYRNNSIEKATSNHFVKVKLSGPAGNIDGLGAKITVKQGEQKQTHYQAKTRGYKSNVSAEIYFGFGNNSQNIEIEVLWPGGEKEVRNSSINQTITFDFKDAKSDSSPNSKLIELTSGNQAKKYGLDHKSEETDYVDFYYEPLLPHLLSRSGPALASGDINGDGREDIYVGGSSATSGYLFIQTSNGKFRKSELGNSKDFEDTDATFFDADGDGDLDLFVCSGSNEVPENDRKYQDRLYLNSGSGRFQLASDALPEMRTSSSTVSSADFDNDGDLDLFVGGRIVPQKYPLPGFSYILRNDNGRFVNITKDMAQDIERIGMVTSSAWADMNNDGLQDLVIAGEFMPVTVFVQKDGQFKNQTESLGLSKTNGWWNTLFIDDIDNDGRMDILAGNLGENTKVNVSENKPLSVYAKDYDSNGKIDPIMSHYIGEEHYVLHSKSTLEAQVIAFRKRFLKHEGFAKATFDELLPETERAGAYTLKAYTFKNSAFLNKADGFKSVALPNDAQVAPVFAIERHGSSYYLSGNSYSTEVVIGQYDASHGLEIQYDAAQDKFVVVYNSDYRASGDIQGVTKVDVKGKPVLVHAVNNDYLYVSDIKR